MEELARPREPAAVDGNNRMEDQRTLVNGVRLGINLEDTVWLLNRDKQRMYALTVEAMEAMEEARQPPCKTFDFVCKWKKKQKKQK